MKAVIRKRDSGKAAELLQLAREEGAIILTENKRAFAVKAKALGYEDVKIIELADLQSDDYYGEKLVVHNADKWLFAHFSVIYGMDVVGFSATADE